MTKREILKQKNLSLKKYERMADLIRELDEVAYSSCGYCEIESERVDKAGHGKFCKECALYKEKHCVNKENKNRTYWKIIDKIDDCQEDIEKLRLYIKRDIERTKEGL